MEDLWRSEYKSSEPTPLASLNDRPDSEKTKQQLWLESKKKGLVTLQDEYKPYCQAPLVSDNVDARRWWFEETQQKTYPNLSRMALDLLSMPATSASPGRLFSAASLTKSNRRNRMSSESIEALECLRSWYKLRMVSNET